MYQTSSKHDVFFPFLTPSSKVSNVRLSGSDCLSALDDCFSSNACQRQAIREDSQQHSQRMTVSKVNL